uniref:UvrD-like helicase ATP-binding domain-containing protein n=1 Tax=Arcella intermedia TaxID=1963864 RepID=A0A6B2KW28_9EUKA
MLIKFHYLSYEVLNLISEKKLGFKHLPFTLNFEEQKLVNNPDNFFILGRSGTGKTTVILMKILKNMNHGEELLKENIHLRQIFITKSELLCSSVYSQFKKYRNLGSEDVDYGLTIDNHITSIPDDFSLIDLDNEPLFITYEKLLKIFSKMLKSDIQVDTFEHFVSFSKFKHFYWKKFPQDLVKKHSPEVIFTEIISVIKGDVNVLKSTSGYLDKPSYLSSVKRSSTIKNPVSREEVYKFFELYSKKKKEERDFDIADFTFNVHKRISSTSYTGPFFDMVFVDEVQDFSPLELLLLKWIGRNTKSYLFAGDTAQTILQGVNFRFEDLTSLFYQYFIPHFKSIKDKSIIGSFNDIEVPEIQQLIHNYRTHSGILNLASVVVEVIYTLFPDTIDKLQPEVSNIAGSFPIFYQGEKGDLLNEATTEFGANQVILVRTTDVKQILQTALEKTSAIVLTITESKGLEFNDVIIYNFWEDSPARHWKLLTAFHKESKQQNFSAKDISLPTELKQLYVAITRGKSNVILYDTDILQSNTMLEIWKQKGVVTTAKKKISDILNSIGKKSTIAEWEKRGKSMFDMQNYYEAYKCFLKCGNSDMQKYSKAEILRIECLQEENPKIKKQKHLEIANLFVELEQFIKAAEEFKEAEDYEEASRYYEIENKYKDAAECQMKLPNWKIATHFLWKAKLFDDACELSLKYCVEEACQLLTETHELSNEYKDQHFFRCIRNFYDKKNKQAFWKKCIEMIKNKEILIPFFEEKGEYDYLIEICREKKYYLKCAHYNEILGKLKDAVLYHGKAQNLKGEIQIQLNHFFHHCPMYQLNGQPLTNIDFQQIGKKLHNNQPSDLIMNKPPKVFQKEIIQPKLGSINNVPKENSDQEDPDEKELLIEENRREMGTKDIETVKVETEKRDMGAEEKREIVPGADKKGLEEIGNENTVVPEEKKDVGIEVKKEMIPEKKENGTIKTEGTIDIEETEQVDEEIDEVYIPLANNLENSLIPEEGYEEEPDAEIEILDNIPEEIEKPTNDNEFENIVVPEFIDTQEEDQQTIQPEIQTQKTDLTEKISKRDYTRLFLEFKLAKAMRDKTDNMGYSIEFLEFIYHQSLEHKHSHLQLWSSLYLSIEYIKQVDFEKSLFFFQTVMKIINLFIKNIQGLVKQENPSINYLSLINIQYMPTLKDKFYEFYTVKDTILKRPLLSVTENFLKKSLENLKYTFQCELEEVAQKTFKSQPYPVLQWKIEFYSFLTNLPLYEHTYSHEILKELFPTTFPSRSRSDLRLNEKIQSVLKYLSFPFANTIIPCTYNPVRAAFLLLDLRASPSFSLVQSYRNTILKHFCRRHQVDVDFTYDNVKEILHLSTLIILLEHYSILLLSLHCTHLYLPSNIMNEVMPAIADTVSAIRNTTYNKKDASAIISTIEMILLKILTARTTSDIIYVRCINLYMIIYSNLNIEYQLNDLFYSIRGCWSRRVLSSPWKELLVGMAYPPKYNWWRTVDYYRFDISTIILDNKKKKTYGKQYPLQHFLTISEK